MARGRGQQTRAAGEDSSSEVQVCPLCIEPLDADEQQFYPCPCGYQVCVFCHKKIELFCNNLCPGCRTEYGSQKDMFDPAARQSSNDIGPSPAVPSTPAKQSLAQGAEAHTPHTHQPMKANSLQQAGWPSLWGQPSDRSITHPGTLTSAQSSSDGASAWPSLAASQRQVQASSAHTLNSSQQPQLQHAAAAQTPAWQSQQPDQPQAATSAERSRVMLSAPLTTGQVPSVQADPDGAALLQQVQSAVGNGELSIEDGTKQLVAFLRQREQTNKGKSAKPPPGFAVAANAQASASLLGKPNQPSASTDTAAQSRSSDAASAAFPSFPALQTSSSYTISLPPGMLSSTHASELVTSQPSPHWSHQASLALGLQHWAYSSGADNQTSSFRSTDNHPVATAQGIPSTPCMFPVDLVAASAALWSAPPAGSNQLQSLSSFGFTQPLAPRKRRGPLYARSSNSTGTGTKEVPTSQTRTYSDVSENKGLQQQSQWQTLGNGMFGDRVTSSPPNRNGFSSNGLQSSVLSGMLGQDGDASSQQTQSQAFTNGLPANGSLFAHPGS